MASFSGVYFTSIFPTGALGILPKMNLAARLPVQKESQGRADCAIEVDMPVDKVKEKS